MVRGLRPGDFRARDILANNIVAGNLERFDSGEGLVLGGRLAQKLGVKPGGSVTLISPKSTATAFGSVPRMRAYRIAATVEVGMYEYDSSFIFMPIGAAQIFFRLPEAVTAIELMAEDPDDMDQVRSLVEAVVGGKYRLHNWQQANSSFFNAIQVERNVMFLILTLIILVAAFNIISSMIMLVKDKGQDIAILRTMGTTRGTVMRIFFLSGASIGVAGTLAGFHQALARGSHRYRSVRRRDLLPVQAAGGGGSAGSDPDRDHGAGPYLLRHPLSFLAGGPSRSGGGVAL
jgi:lipoprotein-releasing system permease protein